MSLETKPAKRLIGYARVSTQQQDLTRQIKALKRLGCSVIYSDKTSGKSMAGRPELARALDDLATGDEIVIAEWDRATRSMWDGLQIIKAVIDAGRRKIANRVSPDPALVTLTSIDSDTAVLEPEAVAKKER